MKIGDLVKLCPERGWVIEAGERDLVGLVVDIQDDTIPRTITVTWGGNKGTDVGYEDGLVVVSAAEDKNEGR